MIRQNILFSICILFLIYISSCSNSTKKKYKEEYYSSGKIKTKGWYIKDSIPVDTIYTFFENGKISSKDIYDNAGNPLKSITYYEYVGSPHKIITYKNGLVDGFFYTFFESGDIESKAFFVSDVQTGDTYYYNQTGNSIKAYSFYEWKQRPIDLIKYDSITGKIWKNIRQAIYIDSIRTLPHNSVDVNEPTHEIQIVISNPPSCRTTLSIEYLSKNGLIIKRDSTIGVPYYFVKQRFPDNLTTIKISGSQYDSITNKIINQTITRNL